MRGLFQVLIITAGVGKLFAQPVHRFRLGQHAGVGARQASHGEQTHHGGYQANIHIAHRDRNAVYLAVSLFGNVHNVALGHGDLFRCCSTQGLTGETGEVLQPDERWTEPTRARGAPRIWTV